MTQNKYIDAISEIARREFGAEPIAVTRMTNGICNEVYSAQVGGRDYIFRLNDEPRYMLGSRNHIPLFKSKGITVPDILAEDYSKSWLSVAFQIQNKLPGRDLDDVIDTLTDGELSAIGAEVANVFRQLSTVPNNGKFGVLWGDDKDLVHSWTAEVGRVTKVVTSWGRQTGVLDNQLEAGLKFINSEYRTYFDRIRPYTYFGDIAGKNVMVHEGRFAGLVDLDSLAQGDPLEAVGRIKARWYGTHHGGIYTEAVMDSLGLPLAQRQIVTMYALLNRIFWALENGVKFSGNSDRTVDRTREAHDKKAVANLLAELQGTRQSSDQAIDVTHRREAVTETLDANVSRPVLTVVRLEPEPQIAVIREPPPIPALSVDPLNSRPDDIKPPRKRRATIAKPVPKVPSVMIPKPPGEPEMEATDFSMETSFAETTAEQSVRVAYAEPAVQTSPQKIMLEANGLSKTYTSDGVAFNALKNVDLRIHKGDCIAIVGKSGSGKSTLMHLLACLDIPSDGYVYVDGDETSTMSEAGKNMLRNEKFGFVFQQFFLNGRDTVFENVVLPMRIRGASDFDMMTDADEALAAVGLADKSDKKAKDLSGGEKQRVCIARALVGKPQVIFADEPTGNLDSTTGAAVEKMLFDLNRDKGITLVFVTHDPDLSQRCERIVEMKDGQIIAEHCGEAYQK